MKSEARARKLRVRLMAEMGLLSGAELAVCYLVMPANERERFDRIYADRPHLLKLKGMLESATPEQRRRVEEWLRGQSSGARAEGKAQILKIENSEAES